MSAAKWRFWQLFLKMGLNWMHPSEVVEHSLWAAFQIHCLNHELFVNITYFIVISTKSLEYSWEAPNLGYEKDFILLILLFLGKPGLWSAHWFKWMCLFAEDPMILIPFFLTASINCMALFRSPFNIQATWLRNSCWSMGMVRDIENRLSYACWVLCCLPSS